MALSNWDTLSLTFNCRERVARPSAGEDAALASYIERFGKAHPELDEGGVLQAVVEDEHYIGLVQTQREARTAREFLVSAGDGSFAGESRRVEICKNWAYVTVGAEHPITLNEGRLSLGEFELWALRGPQTGIYLCAWSATHGEDDAGRYTDYRGLVGCGVYGYDKQASFVGVTPGSLEWFKAEIVRAASNELPPLFAAIDFEQAKRFNQGDVFFASEFGIEAPQTVPGEPGDPLVHAAMDRFEARTAAGELLPEPMQDLVDPIDEILGGESDEPSEN